MRTDSFAGGAAPLPPPAPERLPAMKILIVGNHTCGNRGDSAILRGLVEELQRRVAAPEITITSRYPTSSAWLLGRAVVHDPLHRWHLQDQARSNSPWRRRWRSLLLPVVLALCSRSRRWRERLLPELPAPFRDFVAFAAGFDLVIQVGGSFFVDLYGTNQFDLAFCSIASGTPLLLAGHSVGPFEGRVFHWLAGRLFADARRTYLREHDSFTLMSQAGLPLQHVAGGADTAWLVDPNTVHKPVPWLASIPHQKGLIAITVRGLAPFDRRLGITQGQYEAAFALLIEQLNQAGYGVLIASTCTGLESYNKDDRIVGLRIRARLAATAACHVVMDEFNDVELGNLFRHCVLVIGTRLHSAIIAMNFGTPAIALNYEHKSKGIMEQLGLGDAALPVDSLLDGTLLARTHDLLQREDFRTRLQGGVRRQREAARTMVGDALQQVTTARHAAHVR